MALPLLAAGAGQWGCQGRYSNEIGEDDNFLPEDDTRSTRQFARAQAASGARADGMLYPAHFDGEGLNSLGRQKLDLMLRSPDRTLPVLVYLNVPADDRLKAREASAAVYLKDRGLIESQFHFEVGPNPNATSPVAANLLRFQKTEDTSGLGGPGPVDPQGGPPASPAPTK